MASDEAANVIPKRKVASSNLAGGAHHPLVTIRKVSAVQRTELGVYTAAASLTVIRCPDGRPETDEWLRTLFEDGLKKVVVALPAEIDAFQAAL
jgi:peptidyl-tRNA hydrolase